MNIFYSFYLKYLLMAIGLSLSLYANAQITPTGGIVYVRAGGSGNGSNWGSATGDLQAAINASGVQKVFVAVGTYPAPANGFVMKNNVEIYGGFDPGIGITTLAHNRIKPTETVAGSVLDGQNARRIITNDFAVGSGLNASAVLDGFTIANGYILTSGNGIGMGAGAGIYNKNSSPTLSNLVFRDNNVATSSFAAAMYNAQNSSPVVTNTLFLNNKAGNIGGAVCNLESCSPVFTNVIFKGNEAYTSSVMDNSLNSSPVLKNVLITGNRSYNIINTYDPYGSSSISLINVTVVNNYNRTGELPASVYTGDNSTTTIRNSIIFENISGSGTSSSQYSFIKGNTNTSNGNINTTGINLTDVFTNPSAGDYSLKRTSPVLNKGNNTLYPGLDANTPELAGNPRLVGTAIDIGAYEYPYSVLPDANGIAYVRQVAQGKKDGSSWNDATNDLHNAIHAGSVQKVFVATGTYNVGDNSFIMKNGVEIYGGFDPANGITTLAHSRIMPDPFNNYAGSVLNGQAARPVIWNVFTSGTALNNTAVLDGFTVFNGAYTNGAGIRNVYASPTLNHLVIRGNKATAAGGGIYNQNSSPVIANTVFQGNSVVSSSGDAYGGAIYNISSSPVITNVTFVGNLAQRTGSGTENGAGIYNLNSSPKIYNSIFWNNMKMMTGETAGADIQHSGSGTVTLKNSITQNYSTGVAADNNKVNVNPLFVNMSGSYALQLTSPAIGAGSNALYTGLNGTTKDLAGNPRLSSQTIDIGAYEYQLNITPVSGIVYVKPSPAGNGSGSSWTNATNLLQDAIDGTDVQKVLVAVGNYNVGSNSFIMKNGVEIYGGFNPVGNTTDWDTRTLPNKGMGDGSVLNGLNTRPLIWNDNNGLNNTAILDGFTLMNGTSTHGGAIYNRNTAPAFNNLVIRNNTAATSGGGIYNGNAPVKISNTTIKDNTAQYGGGMRNNGSASVLTNVSIMGNSATMTTAGAGGGGIFNENSALVLNDVLIANNATGFQGGGFRNLSGNPKFTNVTIANNTAVNAVTTTAIDVAGGTPQINNTIVYGTVTGNYTPKYSLIAGNVNTANGNLDATGITLTDIFTNPSAGNYTLKNGSPAIDAGNNTLFTGLDGNTIDLAGNLRVYNFAIGGVVDLGAYESNFTGRIIPDATGIVYVRQGYAGNGSSWETATGDFQRAIDGTNVQKVFVAAGNYNVPAGSFRMKNNVEIYGGFDPDNGIRTLSNVRILPTEAIDGSVLNGQNLRGVIRNTFTAADPVDNTAVLDGFTITNGQTAGNTFGAGVLNVFASPVLRNLVIKNNKLAAGGGAGMANISSSPLLTNVIITGNEALRGGGMYNIDNSGPVLTDVVIKNNTATNTVNFGGGGMFNQLSLPVLVNVDILDNTAVYTGGGIFAQSNSNIQISNSRIENNTAQSGSGGGIYMNSSTLAFDGGTFKNNSTADRGGGIYVQGTSNIQISNSAIEDNDAQTGGGIHMSSTTAVLADVTFKNNTAVNNGGGIYAQNSSNIQISNSLVEDNTANNGGGVYITASTSVLTDINIKNNTAAITGGGMYISNNSSNIQVGNSVIENNTALYGGGLYNNGSASQFTDVIFKGNSATMSTTGAGGGGIFNQNATLKLTNVLIIGNSTNFQGGGFRNLSGNPVLTNITIANNTAVNSAATTAIDVAGGIPQLNNSIVYGTVAGNYTPQYSLIEGRTNTNNGNINAAGVLLSHIFTDAANGDYTLIPCSPAVNAGNNALIPSGITTDIAGNDRILESRVDMGAYENRGFSLHHTANSSLTATNYCQTADGWRHYYHNDGTENKIFISVHPNNQNLGTVTASTKLNEHYGDASRVLTDPYQQVPFHVPFNRSWILTASNSFSNPVGVRFYFSDRDSMDLAQVIPVDSLEELKVYKVNGNDIWNKNSTGYRRHLHGTVSDTDTYIFGAYQGIRYAEFEVNSFSTGTLGFYDNTLPLDLLSFTASPINDKTYLQWHTVNEQDVSHFGIERSLDARRWETLHITSALNGIKQLYDTWDEQPHPGINYYRLKMTDYDGTYKYSKIVEVSFEQESRTPHYLIYPNPNKGMFYIQATGISVTETQMFLFDRLGRLVHSQVLQEGQNYISTKHLLSGMYYLKTENKEGSSTYKVVID